MTAPFAAITQARMEGEWELAGSGTLAPGQIAASLLPGPGIDYRGAMFVYLFRRFGYPIHGWDGRKGLVFYVLTTPDPEVALTCDPASGVWLSFGYGLTFAREEAIREAEYAWRIAEPRPGPWEHQPVYAAAAKALETSIRELLRPVPIRDTRINILGSVPHHSPYADWDLAEPSPQAGYGLGNFDPAVAYGGDN